MLNPSASAPIDARRFRDTLGHYASGITVITGLHGDERIGFTCQSFYSVSTEPPLISFSVMLTSLSYPKIRESGTFVVNVLAHDQDGISNQFAKRGCDKWKGISWAASPRGNPVLDGCLMWLDCEMFSEHAVGDHYIVVGKVHFLGPPKSQTKKPLIYYKGAYRHLTD